MKDKQELLDILASELSENSLNSLDPKDYIDGIYGMNLVTLLQLLTTWASNTDKPMHTYLDEMADKYKITDDIMTLLHNTVEDYYL